MFEYWNIFAMAFTVAFSGAVVPGPLFAYTLNESPRRGAWTGPLVVLGHMFLEAALVLALVFGMREYLDNAVVKSVIAFGGGAVLAWMGAAMLRSSRSTTLDADSGAPGGMRPVVAGVVTSLSNPYWTLWWLTIGFAQLVNAMACGAAGVLVFFAGHILGDLVWYTFVSVAISRGKKVMSVRVYRGLVAVCGLAIAGFAAWFIWSGFVFFRG
jgi:threonine/homoserine/homoserine lactone efflux protein